MKGGQPRLSMHAVESSKSIHAHIAVPRERCDAQNGGVGRQGGIGCFAPVVFGSCTNEASVHIVAHRSCMLGWTLSRSSTVPPYGTPGVPSIMYLGML